MDIARIGVLDIEQSTFKPSDAWTPGSSLQAMQDVEFILNARNLIGPLGRTITALHQEFCELASEIVFQLLTLRVALKQQQIAVISVSSRGEQKSGKEPLAMQLGLLHLTGPNTLTESIEHIGSRLVGRGTEYGLTQGKVRFGRGLGQKVGDELVQHGMATSSTFLRLALGATGWN